jgi:hypothetical protein
MQPIRPVAPVPPYDPGPMPPRTTPFALFGIGAAALGVSLAELLPVLALGRFLALGGVVCGLAGALLGLAGLAQIARQPRRFEGRPMSIAAVVLGLLEALAYGAYFLLGATLHIGL